MSDNYRSLHFVTISGEPRTLRDFDGKALLIVNTASECGNTPQYAGLQTLHEKYHARGLVVLGFPANDFGAQEPGSDETIASFCQANYGVTFPMMSKIVALGEEAHPLFRYLSTESSYPGDIKWNFNKFLIDRQGTVIGRFAPKVDPLAPEVIAAIESVL